MPTSFTSHFIMQAFIFKHHHQKGDCEKERIHIHTLITVYDNYFIIVVNFLLCLIYKSNFILSMYVEKKHSICRVQFCGFKHPMGVLKHISPRKGVIIVRKNPLYHRCGYNAMNSQAAS